jgi:hypothetical protein
MHGGDRKSEESKGQNEPLISTAEKIGAEYGISASTVKRAAANGTPGHTLSGQSYQAYILNGNPARCTPDRPGYQRPNDLFDIHTAAINLDNLDNIDNDD